MKMITSTSRTTARPTQSLCHNDIDQLYDTTHVCCPGYHTLSYGAIAHLVDIFKKAFRAIFQRHQHETILHDMTIKEYTILDDAITTVAGSRHIDLTDYRDPQARTLQRLRTNLVTFVAFKNYHRSQDMIRALTDEHGKIRSWAAFQREVIALGDKYNVHWLQAEYNTVIAAAQAAAQWDDYIRDADIYPYLVYKTQHDDKVRASHQLLHDVCKPIIDTFWDTYYPPNGWRCRCYVLQARTDQGYKKEPDAYPDDKSIPPVFRHNPAKSGKVWNKKHPYFIGINDDIKAKIMRTRNAIINNKVFFDNLHGIDVHYTNYLQDSFEREFNMAKRLSTEFLHQTITMLPQYDNTGIKIPDYKVGDTLIEYKEISSKSLDTIDDHLNNAINQLIYNRFNDVKRRIILMKFLSPVDTQRLVSKFKHNYLVKSHNMELWIDDSNSFKKHKADLN